MLPVYPDEISNGDLADVRELSILFPAGRTAEQLIVAPQTDGTSFTILIDGSDQYDAFECSDNRHWSGLIVSPLVVVLDLSSKFSCTMESPQLGCLVRSGSGISILAKVKVQHGFSENQAIQIVSALPALGKGETGFRKWQLAMGPPEDRRVLLSVSIGEENCTT